MQIAIDGYEANVINRVGVGRYAYEILRHIYQLLLSKEEVTHTVRVYLPSPPAPDMPKETAWWRYRVAKPSRLWTFIGLPLALGADRPKPQVIFSPTHYVPRFSSIPKVMAIMDLSYLKFPELFAKKDLHQLTHWTRYSAGKSAKILTISQFSKRAIMDAYGIADKRIIVTYPGLSMPTNQRELPSFGTLSEKYALSRHYILSVGTLQPRKNYVRLIEAFVQFLAANKQKFSNIQLVIVGKKGWLYEDILKAPKKYKVEDQVKFLKFVDDKELPVLYKNALCFTLPSLYEGFGLPVLEAMAYACPVVISNVSSLPEIAGRAGIYVDPEDTGSITRGLLTAVRERNLAQGKRRIQLGLLQVKKFSWEKAARETLRVLEEVGGKR